MKVTGYALKEGIKAKAAEVALYVSQFDESLNAFEDEVKLSPEDIGEKIAKAEEHLCLLQAAQKEFNLRIKVNPKNLREVSLEVAVKRVGGLGRLAKMFQTVAKGIIRDKWDKNRPITRSKDEEVARPTITKEEALKCFKNYNNLASAYRTEISRANHMSADIEYITEEMLA